MRRPCAPGPPRPPAARAVLHPWRSGPGARGGSAEDRGHRRSGGAGVARSPRLHPRMGRGEGPAESGGVTRTGARGSAGGAGPGASRRRYSLYRSKEV